MQTMAQLLSAKGSRVWSISQEATVFEGLQLMAEKNVGALIITDNNGRPVGMMSERDYARKIILEGRLSRDTRIHSIMTTDLVSVPLMERVERAMAIMTEKRVRHLPVIDQGRLFGIVSMGDLVKAMIDHQQFTIERLEAYIST